MPSLSGRFGDSSGRPYVEAFVFFEGCRLDGVSFCVDTGADRSLLMPGDIELIKPGYDALRGRATQTIAVVGGGIEAYVVPALVRFLAEGGSVHTYWMDLAVAVEGSNPNAYPSLLGQDILAHWVMVHDRGGDRVEFEIVESDHALPPE